MSSCNTPDNDALSAVADDLYRALGLETQMAKRYLREALRLAIVFDNKQKDYGSQNIAKFGEKGVLVRVTDKIERLKNLLWDRNDAAPSNESLADTWDDIHVYAVIGRLCRDNKWE
jgi:hypothetical protein